MSYGIIDYNTLSNIAQALRDKTNSNVNYYPRDMARAINTIISGGGYQIPVLQSTSFYGMNNYDNNIIIRGSILNFEVVNSYPQNEVTVIDVSNWGGMSPDNITFYRRVVHNYPKNSHYWNNTSKQYDTYYYDGLIYGLYVDPKWDTKDVSIIDMFGMFNGCSWIDEVFCGTLTTSLHLTYAGCYNLREAKCGNNVIDMIGAYYSCSNLENAVCGPNVKWFKSAYEYCGNLKNAVCGENVIDMSYSYNGCYMLINGEIGSNVKYMPCAYNGCRNLQNVGIIPKSVEKAYSAFSECCNLTSIEFESGENLSEAYNMFYRCNNLQYINGGNINNLSVSCSNMFAMCESLLAVPNIEIHTEEMYYMFYECRNITNLNFKVANFVNDQPIFYSSYGYNNFYISYAFYNCRNLSQESYEQFMPDLVNYVQERDSMIEEYNANNIYEYNSIVRYNDRIYRYYGSEPITGEFNNSNWSSRRIYNITCSYAFHNCKNLTKVWYSELMDGSSQVYSNTGEIEEVVFVGNVVNMTSVFQNSEIINPACADTVVNMSATYQGCKKIINAVCGPNVKRMAYTYQNCSNLVNAVCGPNVLVMDQTYYNCGNLENAVCGENVMQMSTTYKNCQNLKYAAIGSNVTILTDAYYNCINLIGDVEMGNNVTNLKNAFVNCSNVKNYYIGSDKIVTYGGFVNAFCIPSVDNRRNFVLRNISAHAALTNGYCRAFNASYGLSYLHEEYETPVEVNVNNNIYNAVRCWYNTYYNVYIYCME